MSSDVEGFLAFYQGQRLQQAPRFQGVPGVEVLSFMGTTSRPGGQARVSVHRLLGVAAGAAPNELTVRLAGPLPRGPGAGECLSVHLTQPSRHEGYQVKTGPLGPLGEGVLFSQEGDALTVRGHQLFTVHHSPFTLRFFERIPFEEVRALCAAVPRALVAVGETANLSPRFVFHHEAPGGRLELFHGDGLPLKTWMNLQRNPREVRLVLDLDTGRGFALRGEVTPFTEAEHPVAWRKIHGGFQAAGWAAPSRCLRLTVEAIEPVAPVGG